MGPPDGLRAWEYTGLDAPDSYQEKLELAGLMQRGGGCYGQQTPEPSSEGDYGHQLEGYAGLPLGYMRAEVVAVAVAAAALLQNLDGQQCEESFVRSGALVAPLMVTAWHEVRAMSAFPWALALAPTSPWEDDQKDQSLGHHE